jgi:hypothetical protein
MSFKFRQFGGDAATIPIPAFPPGSEGQLTGHEQQREWSIRRLNFCRAEHRETRKRSAFAHTVAGGETVAGAVRTARDTVTVAL